MRHGIPPVRNWLVRFVDPQGNEVDRAEFHTTLKLFAKMDARDYAWQNAHIMKWPAGTVAKISVKRPSVP